MPPRSGILEVMLDISTDTLPQTCLTYLAFRVAFQETLERIVLANQMGEDTTCGFGFLTEVPFLVAVPPHIQLDLLAETWHKHAAAEHFHATLVDESVVYASCETAARVVEEQPDKFMDFIRGGPLSVDVEADNFLSAELRNLHLDLANEGDFLMISQFEDLHPDESRALKKKFGLEESRLECMFDVLGRWSMSSEFLMNLTGLMSKQEIVHTALKLGVR
ncbi:MAG: hypothetical protein AB7O38_19835 [Pirellulaceae bacterium]